MMFTGSPPEDRGDRVRLFFLSYDAAAAVGRDNPVFPVAVHYDALLHRLLPLEPVLERPGWSTPASHRADGSVFAAGPIPQPLYLTHGPSPYRPRTSQPG